MPTPGLPLRRVDAPRLAREAAFRHCQALGWRVAWATLPAHGSLLRFRQSSAQGEVTSLLPTTAWVARHWPSLPGLAWDALDDASARDLFGLRDGGPIDAAWLREGQSQWLDHLRDPPPGELPCIDTDIGPVWIEALQTTEARPLDVPPGLHLCVDLRLAQRPLRVAQLKAVREGDVLLLDTVAPTALLEGHPLFSFALNEGHIMVIDFDALAAFDDDGQVARQDAASIEPAAAPERRLELAHLSVTVDVLLGRMQQTLASLSDLQPGGTIALAPDAHRKVELRVQGQLLATGELVSVGDGLGVQLLSRVDRK